MSQPVIGVVLRSYQSQGFGNPWYSELWIEATGTRLFQSVRMPARSMAVQSAEREAQRRGYAVVLHKSGRFVRKPVVA